MTNPTVAVASPLKKMKLRGASPSNPNLPFVDKSQVNIGYTPEPQELEVPANTLVITITNPPILAAKAADGLVEKTDLDPRWSSTQFLRFVHQFAASEGQERGGSGPEDFEHLSTGVTTGLQMIISGRDVAAAKARAQAAEAASEEDAPEPSTTDGSSIPSDAV